MRLPGRDGLTLVELIIVVLILGILAAFAVPQYLRTVETGKFDDAAGVVNQIGTVNKMFQLDHGVYVTGPFPSGGSCGSAACPAAGPYSACALVYCKYLADQNWGAKPYMFCACDGAGSCGTCSFAPGGSPTAAAKRQASASGSYATWGVAVDASGVIGTSGTNPPPAPN